MVDKQERARIEHFEKWEAYKLVFASMCKMNVPLGQDRFRKLFRQTPELLNIVAKHHKDPRVLQELVYDLLDSTDSYTTREGSWEQSKSYFFRQLTLIENVLLDIASNPAINELTVRKLQKLYLESSDISHRLAINLLRNPAVPEGIIDIILDEQGVEGRLMDELFLTAASHKNLSRTRRAAFIHRGDQFLKGAVALNPSLTIGEQHTLQTDKSWFVRMSLCAREKIDNSVLNDLAFDTNLDVSLEALCNPRLDPKLKVYLISSIKLENIPVSILLRLARTPDLNHKVKSILAESKNAKVLTKLIETQDLSAELQSKLGYSKDERVIEALKAKYPIQVGDQPRKSLKVKFVRRCYGILENLELRAQLTLNRPSNLRAMSFKSEGDLKGLKLHLFERQRLSDIFGFKIKVGTLERAVEQIKSQRFSSFSR